jgi:hypothetical protein
MERFALTGFIAEAEKMFDEIVLVSSPPDGVPPDAETIAIAEASGHRLIHDTVSRGFGALRTRCISYSSCEWVAILDADEVLWATVPALTCSGTGKFPDTMTPDLQVSDQGWLDQHANLRRCLDDADKNSDLAICLSRRHWFGAPGEWDRPCQNWHDEKDWQLRLVRNTPFLCYDPAKKMHERLVFTPNWSEPKFLRVDVPQGPFIDHYSLWAKGQDPAKNTADAKTYESLESGCVGGMWLKHFPKL